MNKNIHLSHLEAVVNLFATNTYNLNELSIDDSNANNENAPVLDYVLKNMLWNGGLYTIRNAGGLDLGSANAIADGGMVFCKVRKRQFAANEPLTFGPQRGLGSIMNPDALPYFVILAGENLDASNFGIEIHAHGNAANQSGEFVVPGEITNDVYGNGRFVVADEARLRLHANNFVEDLNLTSTRRAFILQVNDWELFRMNSEHDQPFAAQQQPVDAYICFPENDVLQLPDWCYEQTEEVQRFPIVDRENCVGSGTGGLAIHLETGGHRSYIKLPGWAGALLGNSDPASDFRDPDRNMKIHFNIDPVASGGFLNNISGGVAIRELRDINLDLPLDIGSVEVSLLNNEPDGGIPLAGNGPHPGFRIKLNFESGGVVEVEGIDALNTDLTAIAMTIDVYGVVRENRLYWHAIPSAQVSTNGGLVDGEVEERIEKALVEQIEDILTEDLIDMVANFLFALPMLSSQDGSDDSNASLEPDINSFVLLNLLLSEEMRFPNFPTSLLPSNLNTLFPDWANLQEWGDANTSRLRDRFAKYSSFRKDANEPVLIAEFEQFEPHAPGRRLPLNNVVIPRERYGLMPREVRLKDSKTLINWLSYTESVLPRVFTILRRTNFELDREKFYPKLHVEYTVKVTHETIGLAVESAVFQENKAHILAGVDWQKFPLMNSSEILHFIGGKLTPPSFEEAQHWLEVKTAQRAEDSMNDVPLRGGMSITGRAYLELWKPTGSTNPGCGGVLLGILSGIGRGQARAESTNPDVISGDATPGNPGLSVAQLRAMLESYTVSLGNFELSRDITEITGMGEAEPAEQNKMTLSNSFMDIDFEMNRETVDDSLYEWVIARFTSFTFDFEKAGGKELYGERFLVKAYVNGNLLAEADYYGQGNPDNFGEELTPQTEEKLEGLRWRKTMYYRKDDNDAEFVLRFEVIRFSNGFLLAAASKTIPKMSPDGVGWENERAWGIPLGLPATEIEMEDPSEVLSVNVLLQNKLFDSGGVPLSHKPKSYQIDVGDITVHDDQDPFARGELRFWATLDGKGLQDDDFVNIDERRTGVRRVNSGQTISSRLNPMNGSFYPEGKFRLSTRGLDYDSPGFPTFNDNDRLSGTSESFTIPFDDSIDGPFNLAGRDFTTEAEINTTSNPITPVLEVFHQFSNEENTVVNLDSAGQTELIFRVKASWLQTLLLMPYTGNENGLSLDRQHPDDRAMNIDLLPPKPLGLNPIPMPNDYSLDRWGESEEEHYTYYYRISFDIQHRMAFRLLASNVAGHSWSELVRINLPS